MEKAKLDVAFENPTQETRDDEKDVRLLRDAELLLVGGGDDTPNW
jgi:hypothetical protein